MRKSILTAQTLLLTATVLGFSVAQSKVTVDPNTPAATAVRTAGAQLGRDSRLGHNITYHVKLRPISDMTDDLTRMTGITFIAGRSSSDWRVREECATVMATDILLSALMDSIAHVMKFAWHRSGKDPHLTYRLVEDLDAIARVNKRVAEMRKRDAAARQKCWEKAQRVSRMPDQELARIKNGEPRLYLYAKAGVLVPFVELFQKAPEVKEAWLAGEEIEQSADGMSSSAQQALLKAALASLRLNGRLYGAGDGSDYDAAIEKLSKDSRRMLVIAPKSSYSYPVPPLQIGMDNGAATLVSLQTVSSRSDKLSDRLWLRVYEEKRPYSEIRVEMRDELAASRKEQESKVWIRSDTQEPLIDHPADPMLSEPLKKKVAPTVITGLVESLADASGFAIVTDDFRGRNRTTFEQGVEVRKALDTISRAYAYRNWNRNGRLIELWDVNWYDRRESRVSKAWLEAMRQRFKANGTLDIGDLADIVSLTDAQIARNIVNDDVLKQILDVIYYGRRDYLKLYATLTWDQRAMLFSDAGLLFEAASSAQQQSILKLVGERIRPLVQTLDLAGLGARITCSRESEGRRYVYTLRAYTNLGPVRDQYRFRTPLYVEPPKPRDDKKPAQPQPGDPVPVFSGK